MKKELKEAIGAFALATFVLFLLGLAARGVPILKENLGALAGIVFLYMSVWVARRHGKELEDFGFGTRPRKKGLALAAVYVFVVLPLFVLAFLFFYETVCTKGSVLSALAPPGMCRGFRGWEGFRWPPLEWSPFGSGPGFSPFEFFFIQLVVVALPEEMFFRGVIHELCERALPPRWRLWGGGIGAALVLSSLLFAFGHLAVTFDARRLAVFFPALLFGWMRSATGSILAGTLAHAASNLFIRLLQESYFY